MHLHEQLADHGGLCEMHLRAQEKANIPHHACHAWHVHRSLLGPVVGHWTELQQCCRPAHSSIAAAVLYSTAQAWPNSCTRGIRCSAQVAALQTLCGHWHDANAFTNAQSPGQAMHWRCQETQHGRLL